MLAYLCVLISERWFACTTYSLGIVHCVLYILFTMTDSVEQIEMLNKVDSDVENWWRSCLHLASNHVTEMKKLSGYECFNARSVLKDTLAKLLFQGIQLVQAQQTLIKNTSRKPVHRTVIQRVHHFERTSPHSC